MLGRVTTSPRGPSFKATKSISFSYHASEEFASLLEDFRLMCNDAIRVAVEVRPKNRFRLIELAYARLKGYGLHTHYILSACEVAFSACKNRKEGSTPHVRRPFLKLDNQSCQLNHLILRVPTTPRNFLYLTLQGSEYHLSFLNNPNLKRGSVIVTFNSVVVPFSKEIELLVPSGSIGLDLNERNITASATDGWYHEFEELCEVSETKQRYLDIRARISRKTNGDRRITKSLLSKYGSREKHRTESRLHKMTSHIVNYAKKQRFGINMEKLKGIRKLYRKGNRQSRSFRGRMNSWVFGETQRQVDYKSRWAGVPIWYVNPRGTSRNCPNCGSRVVPLADRKLYCHKCGKTWDRDDLASKNIMACAVPQVRSSRGSGDGERGGDGSNPRSRWREVGSPGTHRRADRTRGQHADQLPSR